MTSSGDEIAKLFRADGALDEAKFAPDARAVLDACVAWLESVGRAVFLPIDLLGVLLERGNAELAQLVRGTGRDVEHVDELRALARRVERPSSGGARLHVDQFSLGFTGILVDALAWATECGRDAVTEADLIRVIRWRAELQDSASIRWALRQLAAPGGDFIFDAEGDLRREAFDTPTWAALHEGVRLSARAGLAFLGTPHCIAGFTSQRGLLARACREAGVRPRTLENELLAVVGERQGSVVEFELSRQTLTPRIVRMLIAAGRSAESASRVVSERDVLAAFLGDGGASLDVVNALGVASFLRAAVFGPPAQDEGRVSVVEGLRAPVLSGTPTLDRLGRDLTAEAREGRLPEVRGRDEELTQLINVLLRSEQRNPLLTGDAGVGKTALAYALAARIATGAVPERLASMRVVELAGASLVGGTSYRGELEARIQTLLEECEGDVILFIDEAHAVFAPRSSSGQPAEIPNHFKAALASGKVAVVAATTEAEYRRWIEEDPALRRRFERIVVGPLSPAMTRDILASLTPRLEADYGVSVTPAAVDAAVELSVRFMPAQALPDKAKKLLMDATIAVASECAARRAEGGTEATGGADGRQTPSRRAVVREDVARQVARKTGVPLDRITRDAIGAWMGLEDRIAEHVVGQRRAIADVSRALVGSRLAGVDRSCPQAVLVLVGPAGTGKGAVARAIAVEVFGTAGALLTLEMSDFAEAHAISRLVGSPPGYVGYQDEDALVTPLRRRPASVVLLRDFDRAHPRVQERIARIFAEGEIGDTRGLSADATHAVFVLTIDAETSRGGGIGFGRRDEDVSVTALEHVDPALAALLARHDVRVVAFDGISDDGGALGEALLRHRIDTLLASLEREHGVRILARPETERALFDEARTSPDVGSLERLFRTRVVEPISGWLLGGKAPDGFDVEAPRREAFDSVERTDVTVEELPSSRVAPSDSSLPGADSAGGTDEALADPLPEPEPEPA